MEHWKLEAAGAKRCGENSEVNYRDNVAFIAARRGQAFITNEVIDEIDHFDVVTVTAGARACKTR
jgi:hypothetical protein